MDFLNRETQSCASSRFLFSSAAWGPDLFRGSVLPSVLATCLREGAREAAARGRGSTMLSTLCSFGNFISNLT